MSAEHGQALVRATIATPGARVLFDEGRTDWIGTSLGMFVNLRNEVDHDLIEVEFDHRPGTVYLCNRSLLELAADA